MRQAPNRVATVIIYLRSAGEGGARPAGGEEPLSGGDTLFPCLRAPALGGDGGGGALRTAMSARHCTALVRAFGRGERDALPLPAVAAEARELCANGTGVRITPERGAALLFASSATPDAAQPLPELFHRGCPVRRGVKLMVTFFVARRARAEDQQRDHFRVWRHSS